MPEIFSATALRREWDPFQYSSLFFFRWKRLPFPARPSGRKPVAITFDDGPFPGVTEQVLDAFKARSLKASFFMIGNRVQSATDLVRRAFDEGHDICNHSYSHTRLAWLEDGVVTSELLRTQDSVERAIGICPRYFRPPFGSFRRRQEPLALACGLHPVLWHVNSKDWKGIAPDGAALIPRVSKKIEPGSIVVMHDCQPPTGRVMGAMLDRLMDDGFEPVALSELLPF